MLLCIEMVSGMEFTVLPRSHFKISPETAAEICRVIKTGFMDYFIDMFLGGQQQLLRVFDPDLIQFFGYRPAEALLENLPQVIRIAAEFIRYHGGADIGGK